MFVDSHLVNVFPAATLGALEFSLLYDQENSNLQCTIIRAKVHGDPWDPWECSGFPKRLRWVGMGPRSGSCRH